MSNYSNLIAGSFDREFAIFHESVVRRIHGDHTHSETINAIVEIDNAVGGSQTASGGLRQMADKLQAEQSGVVDVAKSQEINHDDQFEYDGLLWKVTGDATGRDPACKSYVISRIGRIRGRQSNVNTQV